MKLVREKPLKIARWSVLLEWTGNKAQVLPLIELLVRRISDASGCFTALPLCDAQWWELGPRTARRLYSRLETIAREVRFAPFVHVALFCDKRHVAHYRRGKHPSLKGLHRAIEDAA